METLIEVTLTDNRVSPGLRYFSERLEQTVSYRLVQNLRQEESVHGVAIRDAALWLVRRRVGATGVSPWESIPFLMERSQHRFLSSRWRRMVKPHGKKYVMSCRSFWERKEREDV
jgi:hypothetical protein